MKEREILIFNFSIQNQADDSLDVFVDGDIVDASTQEIYKNWFGDETSVSYRSFRDQITKANPKTINVYVNSYGGHVGDAMAMHDFLEELEAKNVTVNRIARGIVASAATYLVMGKNSKIADNAWLMIHNVSGAIWGDVNTVENYATTLRKFNNAIRDFYASKTGQEPEQISKMMNKETWLTADEAVDKGFINEKAGSSQATNKIEKEKWPFQNMFVLNSFNNSITSPQNIIPDMEQNKTLLAQINTTMNNALNTLLDTLGIKNKEDKNVTDALATFSTAIGNALGELKVPTQDEIQNMVNTAVTKALETIPENFTKAINEAVSTGTKNFITEDGLKPLNETVGKIQSAVGNLAGGKTVEKEKKEENTKNFSKPSEFAGADFNKK